jgi:hypothetical protein
MRNYLDWWPVVYEFEQQSDYNSVVIENWLEST